MTRFGPLLALLFALHALFGCAMFVSKDDYRDYRAVRLASGERIRIAGIDAPETQPGNAKCRIGLALGKAAKRKAVALLKGREIRFERVGRSYNRTVARVWLDGRDVAAMLIDQAIARRWPRGRPKPDWCRS